MGIFFGGAIVGATYWTSPESPTSADLVVRGLNELLFPVGCSLVLFSAQALGRDWQQIELAPQSPVRFEKWVA